MAKSLYLIDGHAQIYRAYYAPFRGLSSPTGEPTRATYVFYQMVLALLRDRRPDYLAMVADVSDETVFRKQIFAEYKATRQPPPEDLPPQSERIMGIWKALRLPLLRLEGFEADDLLATICRQLARRKDLEVFLVSKDKDLEQLLSDRVRMYDPKTSEVIGPQELEATKGYRPKQAIEVQALMGDTVDNVPGVRGVGAKTAAKLIHQYGSAEAVIAHADELSAKLAEAVRAFRDQLPISRELVSLKGDVPMEFDLEACRVDAAVWSAALGVFDELGFGGLRQRWAEWAGQMATVEEAEGDVAMRRPAKPRAAARGEYELVDTPSALEAFARKLTKQTAFALDTETTGLSPVDSDLVGMSFSWSAGMGYYLPVRSALGRSLPIETLRETIGPILADAKVAKCGQNLKYDLTVLHNAGLPVAGVEFDSMIASFLLDPLRRSHGIDALAKELLGHQTVPITDLIGKGRDQLTLDQVDPRRVCEYAAEDADVAWRLREVLARQLEASELGSLFRETEMPLVEVLAAMERKGVALDASVLKRMSRGMEQQLDEFEARAHRLAGHSFNVASPKQVAVVLYDEQNLPVLKKTRTGRSTDAEVLRDLAELYGSDLARCLLEHREIAKLKDTYIDTLPRMVSKRTGRIHAGFHQTGAVTGRLSSSDPNLQNIPIRTPLGREIRRAFVPGDEDHLLLSADYSQVELRILAHFSQDEALLGAFRADQDVHAFVAAQVFGVPAGKVTAEQRDRAKAVNFGIVYGQTPFGLARQTKMSRTDAKQFIERYFARYPGVRRFLDECIEKARRSGLATTILGRRRPIEDMHSQNAARRSAAERLAVNTVVQGSAADLIKRAMIEVHRRLADEQAAACMLIQVHDELVFEVRKDRVEATTAMVREQMAGALPLNVPVKVDVGVGRNWLEAK